MIDGSSGNDDRPFVNISLNLDFLEGIRQFNAIRTKGGSTRNPSFAGWSLDYALLGENRKIDPIP